VSQPKTNKKNIVITASVHSILLDGPYLILISVRLNGNEF